MQNRTWTTIGLSPVFLPSRTRVKETCFEYKIQSCYAVNDLHGPAKMDEILFEVGFLAKAIWYKNSCENSDQRNQNKLRTIFKAQENWMKHFVKSWRVLVRILNRNNQTALKFFKNFSRIFQEFFKNFSRIFQE